MEETPLSRQYDTPMGLAHTTMQALKDRIKQHYDLASDYYLSLWGEHIHHGYWPTDASKASESKEVAQANLIQLLLQVSDLAGKEGLRVLDVGCGVGGTSRYLAANLGATVTGITISTRQVELATKLAAAHEPAAPHEPPKASEQATDEKVKVGEKAEPASETPFIAVGAGKVRFIELDAEKMGDFFAPSSDGSDKFDVVWISEALSHFPDKGLFFRNAAATLKPNGRLVLADWFKGADLTAQQFAADIKPIEDGMLLPPLCTQADYVQLAVDAGLQVHSAPQDISGDVKKTWDVSWSLVQNPSLWAFALSQGRDGVAFLQAFRAMRRGYANGSFRYAVMSFSRP